MGHQLKGKAGNGSKGIVDFTVILCVVLELNV